MWTLQDAKNRFSAADFDRMKRTDKIALPSEFETIAACTDLDFDFTSDRPKVIPRDTGF